MLNFFPLKRRGGGRLEAADNGIYAVRARIARKYIRGTGIEFGALNFPLAVPNDVAVRYADFEPLERLRNSYANAAGIRSPDILTDLESMRGIDSASQDFLIANHVLEHVEDPLRAVASIGRVLRQSGIAFVALPDKRFTFDVEREITTLDHLLRDHEEGPDWSRSAHYEEWCRRVDKLDGEAGAQKVSLMLSQRTNIHFHVWDYAAMLELFSYVVREPKFGLDVELSLLNGIEVIWVLRKRH